MGGECKYFMGKELNKQHIERVKVMKRVVFVTLFWFCLMSVNQAMAVSEEDVLGVWLNQAGDGEIEISQQGDVLIGVIAGSTNPNAPDRKDIHNPDPALRTRSLSGLTVFGDMAYQGNNKWKGGWIYDPNNAKTYKCKMTLKGKNRLNIRGFIGVSLIGRTEEWKRKLSLESL